MRALAGRRVGVALANLVGVAALAGVVAYWGWRWGVPPPAPPVRAPIADVAGALAVSPPFGTAPSSAAPAPVAPAAGDPRLLGVFAEPDGRGRALFRWPDGTARLASAGDALGGSATLVAVHP
ncbi:MAG TPA: hypothetical protein VFX05_01385, partial [Casimicrobiaceae bacterium]|nr:hypothetical protein [Casimicrobiaceae bacterium]